MSIARVQYSVFAARKGKTLTCAGCRQPIEKGTKYAWFKVGFRSRFVHTYHVGCSIPDSVRESSMMSGVMAARETAQADIAAYTDPATLVADIESTLESCAEEWRSVGEQYAEAADAMGAAGEPMQEVADSIETAADELTSWQPDEDEPDPDHDDGHDGEQADCDECQSTIDEWVDAVKESAVSAIDDAESNIESL